MSRHQTREVRIFALYKNDVEGEHFGIVRSGTWADVIGYLNKTVRFSGPRRLFLETADGSLQPLMS